jgi:hypothetical protein
MKPQLVSWHKNYAEKGLVVLDIDNGDIDPKANVKANVDKEKLPFAVLWDKAAKNCTKYGIKGYPSAYLIAVDGTVVWEGVPGAGDPGLESAVKAELEKVKK